jgi:hypothetical protein
VPRVRQIASCCGPLVQKQRRLEEVSAIIRELLVLEKAGRKVDPALSNAQVEERRLRNWLAQHRHSAD